MIKINPFLISQLIIELILAVFLILLFGIQSININFKEFSLSVIGPLSIGNSYLLIGIYSLGLLIMSVTSLLKFGSSNRLKPEYFE